MCDQSNRRTKRPGETLDYTIDLTDWLTSPDTIASVSWLTAAGLAQANATLTNTTASIWLAGGADGGNYPIVATITTVAGRVKQFEFVVRVKAFPTSF